MKVVQSSCNLVGHLFSTRFRNSEFPLFKVGKEVTTVKLLHNDIDVVLIFKNIQESDNVWVLTHFKDLNLTALKFYVLDGHLFLGHDFNCDSFARFFMNCRLDKSKFSFAKSIVYLIIIKHISISNDFFIAISHFSFSSLLVK